jgi:hypothetical protein
MTFKGEAVGEVNLHRLAIGHDLLERVQDNRRADGVGNVLALELHLDYFLSRRIANNDNPVTIKNQKGIREGVGHGGQKCQSVISDAFRIGGGKSGEFAVERPNHAIGGNEILCAITMAPHIAISWR